MAGKLLLEQVNTLDVLVLGGVLAVALSRKIHRKLPFFFALLCISALHQAICVLLMFHRHATGLSVAAAYKMLFGTEVLGEVIEAALTVLCMFSVYQNLMKPLPGLHRLGKIVFRWVGAISIVLAAMLALAPHVGGYNLFAAIMARADEAISILTLCLLLFVCFATRPLGLTYRSHLFGLTLGLGVGATAGLVQSAWLATRSANNVYSPVFLISGFGALITMLIWGAYLLKPEPARQMILLPTTSPFFIWNRIAEALGDEPGKVAVGGITPEMFAPAELLSFRSSAQPLASVVEMPQPQAARR